MSNFITLKVGSKQYEGWQSCQVTRGLSIPASAFNLSISKRLIDLSEIEPGVKCQIMYGSDLIMTGIIDEITIDYAADSHNINVSGRSATKDLLDCSALTTGSFTAKTSPIDIVTKLAADYGVKVISKNLDGIKGFNGNFTVESNGEKVFEAIGKLAELQQFSVTDDEKGNLVIFRIDKTTAKDSKNKIIHSTSSPDNNNVLSGRYEQRENDSYSKVIVRGQSKGTDQAFGKQVSNQAAEYNNGNIKRKRVLIIQSQVEVSKDEMQNLANWEGTTRNAKRETWSYKLQGWKQETIWLPGTKVKVNDSFLYDLPDDGTLLIEEVSYSISDGAGTTVDLKLVPFEAYSYQPITKTDSTISESARKRMKAKLKKSGQLNKENDDLRQAIPTNDTKVLE